MTELVTYDTHKVFDLLTTRGYTKEQAQGFVEATKEMNLHKLSTKEDVSRESCSLRTDMEKMEMRLTIKMGAFTFLLGGFLVAIKFFN